MGRELSSEVVRAIGQKPSPRPNTESGRSTANVLRLSCHNNDMIEAQSEFARVPLFML
jgi:hypothetical protein